MADKINGWTRPFYGVSHRTPGAPIQQMTVEAGDRFTEAWILLKGEGFTPSIRRTFSGEDHTERAKRWLEEQAGAFLYGRRR